MKKKLIFAIALVIALISILAGCNKAFKVTSKGHDSIVMAGETTYIAIDNGKSYLYNQKNSRKLTKNGFDRLNYIDTMVNNPSDDYFVAYNEGDIGYKVINAKGETLIESTADMKIERAVLHFDAVGEKPVFTERFIEIYFRNNENAEKKAVFKTDGTAIFYDKNGSINVKYAFNDDEDSMLLDYISCTVLGTINNVDNKTVRFEVFNKDLASIYSQSFSEDIIYIDSSFGDNSLGRINYRKMVDGISKKYCDVFAGGNAYLGYTEIRDMLLEDDNLTQIAFVLFKESDAAFSLIGKAGVLKTFTEAYTIGNNNLEITSGQKINVVNSAGTTILTDVITDGNSYIATAGNINTYYNMRGQKLFEINININVIGNSAIFNDILIEYFVLTNEANEKTHKFFNDGLLVKEYGPKYTLDNSNGDIFIFSTKNEQNVKDNIYYYNFISNKETIAATNAQGNRDSEVAGNFGLTHGRTASYYIQKESKEIVFYSGIVAKITPYTGDKVPSYSVTGGVYNFSNDTLWYDEIQHECISIRYEALEKKPVQNTSPEEYTYESTGEILYAYYMIDGTGFGSGLIELYSGHNMADVYMNRNYDKVVISTVDKFADEENFDIYTSFEYLKDTTKVFDITYDFDKDSLSLSLKAEFAVSNVSFANKKYLVSRDYRDPNNVKKGVYKYDGTEVLAAKYDITEIKGDLVKVTIGTTSGVYNLAKRKLIEDIKYSNVTIINSNLYNVATIKENGFVNNLRDANGTKIVENCNSYKRVRRIRNFNEETITEYFVLYLGKSEEKLLSVTYADDSPMLA